MTALIQTTEELFQFCERLRGYPFITVDTEFIREKTYWPQLCLIQMASVDEAACIDPLAEGIDLSPVFDIMQDSAVTKVFHAARQDAEIFYHLTGRVPAPLFDTQVAAMVCGFGESVSYQTLVSRLAHTDIDKTTRFTDWSRRPLTEKQLRYAVSDVTHLRTVYKALLEELEKSGRRPWFSQEIAVLQDEKTYRNDPQDAWKKIKQSSGNPEFLALLRALAAWREEEAQRLDRPRKHVLRDEQLLEIAACAPVRTEDMNGLRGLSHGFAEGRMGSAILAVVRSVKEQGVQGYPETPSVHSMPKGTKALVKLLKMLLTIKAEQNGVAEKLIASSDDIDRLASEDKPDIPAMKGWRFDLFGKDALALKEGQTAVCYNPKKHRIELFFK